MVINYILAGLIGIVIYQLVCIYELTELKKKYTEESGNDR